MISDFLSGATLDASTPGVVWRRANGGIGKSEPLSETLAYNRYTDVSKLTNKHKFEAIQTGPIKGGAFSKAIEDDLFQAHAMYPAIRGKIFRHDFVNPHFQNGFNPHMDSAGELEPLLNDAEGPLPFANDNMQQISFNALNEVYSTAKNNPFSNVFALANLDPEAHQANVEQANKLRNHHENIHSIEYKEAQKRYDDRRREDIKKFGGHGGGGHNLMNEAAMKDNYILPSNPENREKQSTTNVKTQISKEIIDAKQAKYALMNDFGSELSGIVSSDEEEESKSEHIPSDSDDDDDDDDLPPFVTAKNDIHRSSQPTGIVDGGDIQHLSHNPDHQINRVPKRWVDGAKKEGPFESGGLKRYKTHKNFMSTWEERYLSEFNVFRPKRMPTIFENTTATEQSKMLPAMGLPHSAESRSARRSRLRTPQERRASERLIQRRAAAEIKRLKRGAKFNLSHDFDL